MSSVQIDPQLIQRFYRLIASKNYTLLERNQLQNLLTSKLADRIQKSIKTLDTTLSNKRLLELFVNNPDSTARSIIYKEIRKVVNLVNASIHKYGYVTTELFGRYSINQYIGLLQRAGYAVNEIRDKVNIAQLHKQVFGFMDSLDIKLNNPKLFSTTSRVTVIESAEMDTRRQILQVFRNSPTEIYNAKAKVKSVYPSTEIADLDTNAELVMRRLRQLGFGERINVSNTPGKPYWRSLDDYASTWIEDTQSRAAFLTTTHLCEASGLNRVQWLASLNCCDECQSLDNRVFTLDPNDSEYPYLSHELPVHPHCQCQTVPYAEGFDQLRREMHEHYNEPQPLTVAQQREQAEIVRGILNGI